MENPTKYDEWIRNYTEDGKKPVLGKCREAVVEMIQQFPELKEVRGHVLVMGWGMRGHAWCVDPDGIIVDPTKSQFPIIIVYEPWVPGTEVRVGKCMECGSEIWAPVFNLEETPARKTFCSEECETVCIAAMG